MTSSVLNPPPEPLQCSAGLTRPMLTLVGVWPAPPSGMSEAIGLSLYDDTPLDLDHYYLLKNDGSKRYLHGLEMTSGSLILTGNFALSNTNNTCVTLRSDDDVFLDSLCYMAPDTQSGVRIGSGASPWGAEFVAGLVGTGAGSGSVTIDLIIYGPPGTDTGAEQITITNHSNTAFLPGDLWILIGEAKTKRYWRALSTPGSTVTATASFSLPNSTSTCIELHYARGLLDTMCYTISPQQSHATQTSDDHSAGAPAAITITNLIANPPGPDTNNESLTLLLAQEESPVDLSDYRLLVGTSFKKLKGILPGIPLTITKTRGLPNSRSSCATLLYGQKPIDYWCGSPHDQVVSTTGSTLSGASVGSLSIQDIVYDPPGADTGREQILLSYSGSAIWDLSHAYLLINGR